LNAQGAETTRLTFGRCKREGQMNLQLSSYAAPNATTRLENTAKTSFLHFSLSMELPLVRLFFFDFLLSLLSSACFGLSYDNFY
jgi:hypothetical protein